MESLQQITKYLHVSPVGYLCHGSFVPRKFPSSPLKLHAGWTAGSWKRCTLPLGEVFLAATKKLHYEKQNHQRRAE